MFATHAHVGKKMSVRRPPAKRRGRCPQPSCDPRPSTQSRGWPSGEEVVVACLTLHNGNGGPTATGPGQTDAAARRRARRSGVIGVEDKLENCDDDEDDDDARMHGMCRDRLSARDSPTGEANIRHEHQMSMGESESGVRLCGWLCI